MMLAVVLIYQQVEDSILTPLIQRKAVKLSAFFIGEVTNTYRAQVALTKVEPGAGGEHR